MQKNSATPHLTQFLEKSTIQHWAQHIGFKLVEFIDADWEHFDGKALGQSVVILEK